MLAPDLPQQLMYTPAEVADQLRIGKSKAYALLASGEIQSVRIGALLRVTREALVSYIEGLAARGDGAA
jgi:excisionase family DNA binding protein